MAERTGNAAVRIEKDALGELAVPVEALYGIHTQRALTELAFSTKSLGSYPRFVRALGQVKRAAARANRAARVVAAHLADAIDESAQPLIDGTLAGQFPVDVLGGGGSIGIHMNVNEVLANLANEGLGSRRGLYDPIHPKLHVGASQSTADVCHTACRLAILDEWTALDRILDSLVQTVARKGRDFSGVTTLARTCLQDAMPTSMATLFGGYRAQLVQGREALHQSVARLYAVSLGGTVIGTGEGAPDRYSDAVVPILASISGKPLSRLEEVASSLQSSSDLRAVSGSLAILAETLLKLCQDLRLLGSGPRGGFGELVLPHVLEGSSFFGNKRNPVIPETMMQCCFQVLGCDRIVQAASERAELYLNVFDGAAAINLLDALSMMGRAITLLERNCLRDLAVDAERCGELVSRVARSGE